VTIEVALDPFILAPALPIGTISHSTSSHR
jgi:hypothetical protein